MKNNYCGPKGKLIGLRGAAKGFLTFQRWPFDPDF
jgi:hypothetical protein